MPLTEVITAQKHFESTELSGRHGNDMGVNYFSQHTGGHPFFKRGEHLLRALSFFSCHHPLLLFLKGVILDPCCCTHNMTPVKALNHLNRVYSLLTYCHSLWCLTTRVTGIYLELQYKAWCSMYCFKFSITI